MIEIVRIQETELLSDLKNEFVRQATAPLDGMWLFGFVPMARHYGFCLSGKLIGYCCVNGEGYLLQFHIPEPHSGQARDVLSRMLTASEPTGRIAGAFVSTAEPRYLSLCADRFSDVKVNALMYELGTIVSPPRSHSSNLLVESTRGHLNAVVQLAHDSLGAPTAWLEEYFSQLIERQELYGLWNDGQLLATGECRSRDSHQMQHTDVGVIVAKSKQGQGLGTDVLRQLVQRNEASGQRSICSTERDNLAAQKAIESAGFVAFNRILQFTAN